MTLRSVVPPVASLLVVAACALTPSPSGWVFPSPQPPPPRAMPVAIDVAPVPVNIPPDTNFGCPAALLSPVELVADRSTVPPTVGYRSVGTGEPVNLDWSWGVSAYELDRVVTIVGPTGVALMTEGQVANGLGGGGGGNPNSFSVCLDSSLPTYVGERAAP